MTSKKLYQPTAEGGIKFKTDRRPWEVRIPAWVYDLWMPLVGAEAIGVYALYCRLEMNEGVRKITMRDIARAARIGDKRLNDINGLLQDCGFVTINKPGGAKRLMHWTTEIIVHDPPQDIAFATIQKYQHPQGYTPVSKWLVDSSPETLGSVSDDTDQGFRNPPCSVSNIEPLEVVGSLETTTTPTPPTPVEQSAPVVIAASAAGGGGRASQKKTPTEIFLADVVGSESDKARKSVAHIPLDLVRARWERWRRENPKAGPGAFIVNLRDNPPTAGEATKTAEPIYPPFMPGWSSLTDDQQQRAWRDYDRAKGVQPSRGV